MALRILALLLALASALLVAFGAWLVFAPAGFIAAGIECAAGAYMAMEYAKARDLTKARRR